MQKRCKEMPELMSPMRPKISSNHLAGKLDEPGIGDQNDLRVALGRLAARQDDAHPVALGMKHHMLVGKPKHPTCPEQAVEPNGGQYPWLHVRPIRLCTNSQEAGTALART